ncbi:NFACT RNA binding domain-containing protein [Aureibacter tunicatorum]|uniref:Ribosome quality control (RQC) complex YloA/Tae2 family protein n=1 Tax=Aureibacter tunicatorum TaxID=866807 RepID=A0AAE4BRU0_9BACT|nr:NFACT RNA binding domain-containing protein [Aureibacter tunicatorum]MDR6239036.1 putative ribosome quality control (RQC) complex YloA/Tae2 family protein [Aureibacter tunicatorum]
MKAYLMGDFSCLYFPKDFRPAKRNRIDLFQEIINKKVIGIKQYLNERSFSINFEDNFKLLFKMHGNRSNLILFHDGKLTEIFKSHLLSDHDINIDELDRNLDLTKENFIESEGNLKKVFPTFGLRIRKEIESQGFNTETTLEGKWNIVSKTLDYIENPKYYLGFENGLYYLTFFPEQNNKLVQGTAFEAINEFFITFSKDYHLNRERAEATKSNNQQVKKTEQYIKKAEKKINELVNGVKYNEIADVIMANLHAIPQNSDKVELYNFYSDSNISIALKKNHTPQKNAEIYYKKSKNQKIEIDKLNQNLDKKLEELIELNIYSDELKASDNIKELRKLIKAHQQVNTKKSQSDLLPYFKFHFNKFEIWVGRNPKANDSLTQKHAYKEDLWLHAKDVPGSHVIIKHQANKAFPKDVIEHAAQIAAYYSKRKTDSLCPVTYTPKKYIRKPKGLAAGKVIIDKENVILVQPQRP